MLELRAGQVAPRRSAANHGLVELVLSVDLLRPVGVYNNDDDIYTLLLVYVS
jgi:hypothetical protein